MTEPLKILSLNQRRILTLQGSQPSMGTYFSFSREIRRLSRFFVDALTYEIEKKKNSPIFADD